MAYGDQGGATAYLIGEENRGLEYMFIMMNMARHAVGVEGYAIAERAYQRARSYATERVQGRAVGDPSGKRVTIIDHPDVARMMIDMKSRVEAMRAVSLYAAQAMDCSIRQPDERAKAKAQQRLDVLIPVVKGWSSEVGNLVTGVALQVHGGMGFIEETGAAQHYRDARITTIYEGTTGIQAADLVGRKLLRDGGEAIYELIEQARVDLAQINSGESETLKVIFTSVSTALDRLSGATGWILEAGIKDPRRPYASSSHYLMLWGSVAGGWQMARAAGVAARHLATGEGHQEFYRSKSLTCRHYCEQVLPESEAHYQAIISGSDTVLAAAQYI